MLQHDSHIPRPLDDGPKLNVLKGLRLYLLGCDSSGCLNPMRLADSEEGRYKT